MVGQALFEKELRAIGYDPTPLSNLATDGADQSHFVIAGPGTGKTTALAIRAVKLVFVDGVDPGSIVAVTFMRRASKELRSKILELADLLRRRFITAGGPPASSALSRIDFNRIYTGTLDSLAQEVLTDFRGAGNPPPIVIDEQTANVMMLREGLFRDGRFRKSEVYDYAVAIKGTSFGLGMAGVAEYVREFHDRSLFDEVDLDAFKKGAPHPGAKFFVDAIVDYRAALAQNNWFDYALLEDRLRARLQDGSLTRFTNPLRVILVDEYQDTNFLQERIYFELARAAVSHGGGVSVVGDDDQALYRFRGATTELFTSFPYRANSELTIHPTPVYLNENRRSSKSIIDFVNSFPGPFERSFVRPGARGRPHESPTG